MTEILAAVSALALGLAAVGLFGLISYAVAQRTREFGVRLALGAHPRTITSGVIREALALTLGGLALGFASSIPIALILSDGLLPTISWLDPVPAVAVGLVLITVAVLASLARADECSDSIRCGRFDRSDVRRSGADDIPVHLGRLLPPDAPSLVDRAEHPAVRD